MTIRAVLFDLDGTLVNSLPDIGGSMNQVLEDLGLPTYAMPAYREFVGEGVSRLVERALPFGREELRSEAEEAFRRVYAERLTEQSAPYPGIAELLDRLADRAMPFAVCSNKPQVMTERVVAALFDRWKFEGVEGQREERPRKPDPAAALELAATLRLSPADVAFVGDTKTDMETATRAGMQPIGVLWGFRDRAELEAHGARAVFGSPAELADWLTQ